MKIAHKISRYHLDVKGSQRQKVRPAAQLLSNTVSKAIQWCGDNNLIKDTNYAETSNFIKLANDWFDIFNTNLKFCPSGSNAYGINLDHQDLIINTMTETMSHVRGIGKKTLLPFQKGIIISNKSLQGLYQYITHIFKVDYILTRRLNQDVLENFFSFIRAMGGSNDHPNPVDFKYRLRWYILGKHSAAAISANKNCEKDEDEALLFSFSDESGNSDICLTHSLFSNILDTGIEDEMLSKESDVATLHFADEFAEIEINLPNTQVSQEGLQYVAGYVAHRFRLKYPHLGTPAENIPGPSSSNWIHFLSQGNLLQPCADLIHAAKILETLFLVYQGDGINQTFLKI